MTEEKKLNLRITNISFNPSPFHEITECILELCIKEFHICISGIKVHNDNKSARQIFFPKISELGCEKQYILFTDDEIQKQICRFIFDFIEENKILPIKPFKKNMSEEEELEKKEKDKL
jgi:hypothetical protein